MENPETIKKALDAVDLLIAEAITYDEYLNRVPEDPENDALAEILSLVEHLPSGRRYAEAVNTVRAKVAAMRQRMARAP